MLGKAYQQLVCNPRICPRFWSWRQCEWGWWWSCFKLNDWKWLPCLCSAAGFCFPIVALETTPSLSSFTLKPWIETGTKPRIVYKLLISLSQLSGNVLRRKEQFTTEDPIVDRAGISQTPLLTDHSIRCQWSLFWNLHCSKMFRSTCVGSTGSLSNSLLWYLNYSVSIWGGYSLIKRFNMRAPLFF